MIGCLLGPMFILMVLASTAISKDERRYLQGSNIITFAAVLTTSNNVIYDNSILFDGSTTNKIFTKAYTTSNVNTNLLDKSGAYRYGTHNNDVVLNVSNVACPVSSNGISYSRFNTHVNIYKQNDLCLFKTLTNIQGMVVFSPTLSKQTRSPTAVPTKIPTLAPTQVPTFLPTPLPTDAPTESPTSAPTMSGGFHMNFRYNTQRVSLIAHYVDTIYTLAYDVFDVNMTNILDPPNVYDYGGVSTDNLYDPTGISCPLTMKGLSVAILNTHINIFRKGNFCYFMSLAGPFGTVMINIV